MRMLTDRLHSPNVLVSPCQRCHIIVLVAAISLFLTDNSRKKEGKASVNANFNPNFN